MAHDRGSAHKYHRFHGQGQTTGQYCQHEFGGSAAGVGDKIHANRLLKWEMTTDSSSTNKTTDEDNSPETKLEGMNGGHAGDFKKSTSKEDKMDRGSGKEEEDENVTDSGRSLCPFSGSFPAITLLCQEELHLVQATL